MRFLLAALTLVVASGIALADEPVAESAPDVAGTIDRGLAFLAKDALAWKEEHGCVSCHHAGLVVWSMREARQRGIAVDETVLDEMTEWIATSGDGKTSVPRPEGIPRAFNEKAVHFAVALGADAEPDATSQEGLKLLLATVKEDQLEDGSWASWPETRPPIFGHSDQRSTALATLALLPSAAAEDETAIAARDKGVEWLRNAATDDDPQSMALRVVLWSRLNRPAEEIAPLVARIRERQQSDGGWRQAADMTSDAWATGQALYALAHAGVTADDPAIRRGQAFLVRTQRDDGGWQMTSRAITPGGEGSKNLIPITGAGSAWAVLGLVRSR